MSQTILMVVTSHGEIAPGLATGVWFDEFAEPYDRFRKAGFEIKVASPRGGPVPLDPRSLEASHPGATAGPGCHHRTGWRHASRRLCGDLLPRRAWHHVRSAGESACAAPGGRISRARQGSGAVCHGPACLVGAMLADGRSAVQGRKVAAFTNSEEKAVQLDRAMPFLLQDKLQELGGTVDAAEDWADHVVVDGRLVTGQNPQSSRSVADAIVRLLRESA